MLGTTTMLVVVMKGLIMTKGYKGAFGLRCMHSEESRVPQDLEQERRYPC